MAHTVFITCKFCGKQKEVLYKHRTQKYCDASCRSKNSWNLGKRAKDGDKTLQLIAQKGRDTKEKTKPKKYVCKVCNEKFAMLSTFREHLANIHQLTSCAYVVKFEYSNKHPICACGCGQQLKFDEARMKFNRLIKQHVTQEIRDNVSIRKKGTITSIETKEKLSSSLVSFYETDKGKEISDQRSAKLLEFHQSEEGKIWSQEQSQRLKEFNATSEGKQIRKDVGEKVSKFYQDPKNSQAMSESVKAFYDSPTGEIEKEKRRLNFDVISQRLEPALQEFIFDFKKDDYKSKKTTILNVKCKNCGFESLRSVSSLIGLPRCFSCKPFPEVTKQQREIGEYIQGLNLDVVYNDWKTFGDREIDVFVPSRKFGVEFNGLYWHSEKNRSYFRHVDEKHDRAKDVGIKLLTVFEDEWRDKRLLIESMIKHRLNLCSNRFYARNLKIVDIDHDQRKIFFNESHLSGDVKSLKSFALTNSQNEILCAISLRKPFHKELDQFLEVARFATSPNISVIGGLSKLCNKAYDWAIEQKFEGLLTYVDARFGDGQGYVNAKFEFLRKTGPRFWWTDFENRFDRFKYRAHDGLTQKEVSTIEGVWKIWGAGNYVLIRKS